MHTNSKSISIHVNIHLLLKPAHGLLFADAVPETDAARLPLLVSDAEPRSAQNLHIHTRRKHLLQRLVQLN